MTIKEGDFVDARPINGYLTHAVRYYPSAFHQTAPRVIVTYSRALCGVGRGGMRAAQNRETGEIQPFRGIDGCDRCHVKLKKIRERGQGN